MKPTMIKEKLKQFALMREIQILAGLTVVVGFGYYFYLKNKQKKQEAK